MDEIATLLEIAANQGPAVVAALVLVYLFLRHSKEMAARMMTMGERMLDLIEKLTTGRKRHDDDSDD